MAIALLVLAAQFLVGGGVPALAQRGGPPPEGESGLTPKPLVHARTHMVSSANPHATEAGLEILRTGGSAVDAAIAVQLVLGLVEPQSSGIGGGAFLLHWDQRLKRLRSYDGRETAPAAVTPDLFMANGQPRRFGEALVGGQSVGVPGVVRMLARAHERHGKLPWARLFAPAIALAERGFTIGPRLASLVAWRRAERFGPTARRYFFDAQDKPLPAGTQLTNPDYAATLRAIAERGPDAFYSGPIAEAIVKAVRESPVNPGALSLADVAGYQPKDRPPACVSYRRHRVCSMGPPSSGGLVLAMTLKIVEPYDLGRAPMNAAAVHIVAEAEKLAYADRDHWIGDPDAVVVPSGLTDPRYLAERRKLISTERAQPSFRYGTPPGASPRNGPDATQETAGTSHASVVDRWGNAVALTTSIEAGFGSGVMAGGFLLNNQLTDFSFRPRDEAGAPAANAVGSGKRPRSSMAPTMIFNPEGRLLAVLGAPGGSQIPLFVIKSVIGIVDWGLDAQAALDLPNFGSRNGPLELEKDATGALLPLQLKALGHEINVHTMTSGLHAIVRRRNGTLEGGADPRREGLAKGD